MLRSRRTCAHSIFNLKCQLVSSLVSLVARARGIIAGVVSGLLLFVSFVLLANDPQATLSSDKLALGAHKFQGTSYFVCTHCHERIRNAELANTTQDGSGQRKHGG